MHGRRVFDVPILFVLTAASLIKISNLDNRIVFRPLRGVFQRPSALREEPHLGEGVYVRQKKAYKASRMH